MEQLSNEQKAIIFVSLRAGDGFTIACINAGLLPQNVSEYIKEYPSFADECLNYISSGIAELLQKRQQHLSDNNYELVRQVDELKSKFVNTLNLWGCAGKPIFGVNIQTALKIYKRPEEVSTAYGMTTDAFYQYRQRVFP